MRCQELSVSERTARVDFPPWSGGVRSERHAAARRSCFVYLCVSRGTFVSSGPEAPRGQAHQMFVTTDFKLSNRIALHLGLGHGLTHASDRWAGKVIFGIDF